MTHADRGLVFDTMTLSAYAEADRLDVLGSLLAGYMCWTTNVVHEELRSRPGYHTYLGRIDELDWLRVTRLESDDEIDSYLTWADERLGGGPAGRGEASVLAYAETHAMAAITDDKKARRVGAEYGVEVHGSLWVLAGACRTGKLTERGAGSLIDDVRAVGLYLPCDGEGFAAWAVARGLPLSPPDATRG